MDQKKPNLNESIAGIADVAIKDAFVDESSDNYYVAEGSECVSGAHRHRTPSARRRKREFLPCPASIAQHWPTKARRSRGDRMVVSEHLRTMRQTTGGGRLVAKRSASLPNSKILNRARSFAWPRKGKRSRTSGPTYSAQGRLYEVEQSFVRGGRESNRYLHKEDPRRQGRRSRWPVEPEADEGMLIARCLTDQASLGSGFVSLMPRSIGDEATHVRGARVVSVCF